MIHGAFLARLKDTNPQLVQSALASEKKTGLLMKCIPCWMIRLLDIAHVDRVSCLVSRVSRLVCCRIKFAFAQTVSHSWRSC